MINTTKSLCPPCLTKIPFSPRILPTIFECECPEEKFFIPQEINTIELCPCPSPIQKPINLTFNIRKNRPRDCYENYIKQIASKKFCSPQGPKCI